MRWNSLGSAQRGGQETSGSVRPAVGGAIHSLLWGRDTSQAAADAFLQLVDADLLITGHIPCEKGFDAPNSRQIILDCMAAPAAYCLFPTNRPLTHQELAACVGIL